MTTFINTTNPFLRILDPASGEYVQFLAGKLELDESDPKYAVVAAEAARNPFISIMVSKYTCPDCGEEFKGNTAAARLGKHRKDVHFDKWLADKEAGDAASSLAEVKSRAGVACDICQPVQTFGDADGLAEHVRLVHSGAPALDAEGNTVGGDEGSGGAAVSTEVPAAQPSGG